MQQGKNQLRKYETFDSKKENSPIIWLQWWWIHHLFPNFARKNYFSCYLKIKFFCIFIWGLIYVQKIYLSVVYCCLSTFSFFKFNSIVVNLNFQLNCLDRYLRVREVPSLMCLDQSQEHNIGTLSGLQFLYLRLCFQMPWGE